MKNKVKHRFLWGLRFFSSDKAYYKVRFLIKFKKRLNLKNPDTFNAKINYLKLYDRDPLYTKLVDKYEVREYVKEKIGEKYLNEIYGVYSNVDEIDFSNLPESFVLKATHGSSWVLVCKDKSDFDQHNAKKTMQSWLNNNFYKLWGEWVYKNVPPRIICEKFLFNTNESSLIDYKFYCFNGKPKFIHVDMDRFDKHTRNFYDLNWLRLPFGVCYPQAERDLDCPKQLNKMIELASILSKDLKMVRVDFYEVGDLIIFGELTFYPGNGLEIFDPQKYDFEIGKLLTI